MCSYCNVLPWGASVVTVSSQCGLMLLKPCDTTFLLLHKSSSVLLSQRWGTDHCYSTICTCGPINAFRFLVYNALNTQCQTIIIQHSLKFHHSCGVLKGLLYSKPWRTDCVCKNAHSTLLLLLFLSSGSQLQSFIGMAFGPAMTRVSTVSRKPGLKFIYQDKSGPSCPITEQKRHIWSSVWVHWWVETTKNSWMINMSFRAYAIFMCLWMGFTLKQCSQPS